jgi:hypothetical protein
MAASPDVHTSAAPRHHVRRAAAQDADAASAGLHPSLALGASRSATRTADASGGAPHLLMVSLKATFLPARYFLHAAALRLPACSTMVPAGQGLHLQPSHTLPVHHSHGRERPLLGR